MFETDWLVSIKKKSEPRQAAQAGGALQISPGRVLVVKSLGFVR